MAALPSVDWLTDSTREPDDGHVVDYGQDGSARVRVLYSATQWAFDLRSAPLTTAQRDSLLSHYAAHRLTSFTFTWPGGSDAYTCVYTARPIVRESEAVGLWDVKVQLQGQGA